MTERLLQTSQNQSSSSRESIVAVVPKEVLTVRRLAVVLIGLEGVLLVALAVMRGGHPPGHDELNILETGIRMLGNKGNPHDFVHGSFIFDLMAGLHGLVYLARGLVGFGWDPGQYLAAYVLNRDLYLLAGRLIVVLFSIILLAGVYRLAKVLYSDSAGLLATGLLSFGGILPLTGTSLKEDLLASTLALFSILFLCDASMRLHSWARWSLAGALCGMAIAAKYTIVALVMAPIIMALGSKIESPWRLLTVFMVSAGATFLLIEPYIVIELPKTLEAFHRIQGQHFAGGSIRALAPRFLGDYLPLGLGIPLLCGVLPAAARALYGGDVRLRAIIAYFAVVGLIFMWTTGGMPRYVITLAPFMCVVVAGEICRWRALAVRRGLVLIGLALLLTWPANIISLKFIMLLSRPDTRPPAQAWIEATVPAGSKVLLEGTISGEPTFAPALLPTDEWFKARLEEARAVGSTGQLLQASALGAAQSGRPRYHLIEKAAEDVADFNGVDYLVLSDHHSLPHEYFRIVKSDDPDIQPLIRSRQEAMRRVQEEFTEIFSVSPVPDLRFDWFDNPDYWRLWSAPLENYDQWRLGPVIRVYRRHSLKQAAT